MYNFGFQWFFFDVKRKIDLLSVFFRSVQFTHSHFWSFSHFFKPTNYIFFFGLFASQIEFGCLAKQQYWIIFVIKGKKSFLFFSYCHNRLNHKNKCVISNSTTHKHTSPRRKNKTKQFHFFVYHEQIESIFYFSRNIFRK